MPVVKIIKTVFLYQSNLIKYASLSILNSLLLFICSLSILLFITPNIQLELSAAIMTLLCIYSIMLCTDLVIIKDFKNNLFHQFILTGQHLEIFVFAKILAAIIILSGVFSPILIFYEYVSNGVNSITLPYFLIQFFLIINISLNSITASAFLLSYEKKIAQILISFFMNIPIFIMAALSRYPKEEFILFLLFGLFLINLPIAILATSSMIKNSLDSNLEA